jgi:hypothetical protein
MIRPATEWASIMEGKTFSGRESVAEFLADVQRDALEHAAGLCEAKARRIRTGSYAEYQPDLVLDAAAGEIRMAWP